MLKYVFNLIFIFASAIHSQNVSGHVQDFQFNSPLEMVSVTLKNNSNGEILGTDSTDASGNYSIDYTIVGVNEFNPVPSDFYLSNPYPQPFNPSVKIDFSTPHQGKFTARIYNIIGQLIYTRDFSLSAGNHAFNISGLGSAGVYLFNLSSDDFTTTQKLVLLDGGSGNINVEISAATSGRLNKTTYDDLLIEFRKDGYSPIDTVVVWDLNLFVDGRLSQIPMSDTIMFFTSQNLIPTNTPANNASVAGSTAGSQIFVGSTDQNGEFNTSFIVHYIVNPDDSTQKTYNPSLLTMNVSRNNAVNKTGQFVIDGSDISWYNDLQQTMIYRNGSASGNIQNEIGQPVINANVKLYNNDNNNLFGQGNTNVNGNYLINFSYWGYENDPGDEHTPINELRKEATASNHESQSIVKPFVNPVVTDFVLDRIPYVLNATIKLYNTKGDVITNLDSLEFTWPDGSIESFANNNGIVQINKLLYTLNSDTTAIINHNRPNLYLKWFMGTTYNPDMVELIYQNPGPGPNTIAKVPLNKIKSKTTELYLIPKQTTYGINNDLPIAMDSPTIIQMFSRGGTSFGIVSKFMPSPRGFDTTDVIQLLYNRENGTPIDSNWIMSAKTEVLTFLESTQWIHKKLLNYRFTQIPSNQDPLFLYLTEANGRNWDNVSITSYPGPPVNWTQIALDSTWRIYQSSSWYSTPSVWTIQEEFFCSMTNVEFDGADYVRQLNGTFTDLGKHIIGICYIMRPKTYYYEW